NAQSRRKKTRPARPHRAGGGRGSLGSCSSTAELSSGEVAGVNFGFTSMDGIMAGSLACSIHRRRRRERRENLLCALCALCGESVRQIRARHYFPRRRFVRLVTADRRKSRARQERKSCHPPSGLQDVTCPLPPP